MEVKLTSGGTTKISLRGKRLKSSGGSRSEFQYRVGQDLQEKYPYDSIFEEIYIPGENFVLDFFIPSLGLVVECHGEQHTKQVKFFHPTKKAFHNQLDRDKRKREWCDLNGFKLIEIYDA